MQPKFLMPAFIGLSIVLFACDRVDSKHGADDAVDTEAIASAIQAQEAEMLAAFKAKDGAKVASHYAEDAVVATPGRAAGHGKAAISAMMAEDFKDPAFTLDFTNEKTAVAASGDLAYTRGTFRVSYTNPQSKKAEKAAGSYVTVFRKQADGSWKVVEDLSTPGAAPEA
jgi:uncharacterized protein (TIGR02246 family)